MGRNASLYEIGRWIKVDRVNDDYTAAMTVHFHLLQPTGDAAKLWTIMGVIAPICVHWNP